jgi:hypothetical protein
MPPTSFLPREGAPNNAASPLNALSAAKKIIVEGSRLAFDDAIKLERDHLYQLAATITA